jgi:8-oxo-dGTP pyrophosphatase MutT (NUDIX family)
MHADLAAFLANRSSIASETVVWGARMRLRAVAYLTADTPPLRYVTSVRAVVRRDGLVLVQQDRDNRHILPGGRREDNELPEATLRREVAEETGWSLGPLTPLGVIDFHHLDPKPPGYAYSHPDFCWLVYTAEATNFSLETRLDDGYEIGSAFLPADAARALALPPCQRALLDAVLKMDETKRHPSAAPESANT